MKKLMFVTFLLMGCRAQLRAPFCQNSLSKLPPEIVGFYEISIPMNSIEMSGASVVQTVTLQITEDHLRSSGSLMGGDVTAICEVAGKYYMESLNPNGTYGVTEIYKSNDGLVLTDLALNTQLALDKKFEIHYLPKAGQLVAENHFQLSIEGPAELILNNQNLSMEEQLSVMKPISIVRRLIPVPAPTRFKPKFTYRVQSAKRM